MNTPRPLNETPRERLERVARVNAPYRRTAIPTNSPLAVLLLLTLAGLILAALAVGLLGSEAVGDYARRILEWAW